MFWKKQRNDKISILSISLVHSLSNQKKNAQDYLIFIWKKANFSIKKQKRTSTFSLLWMVKDKQTISACNQWNFARVFGCYPILYLLLPTRELLN